MRKNISTNTPSERRVGYSRAVVVGKRMYVSGTTSVDNIGQTVGKTTYEQTTYIFRKIIRVIERAKFSTKDVVFITAYLVRMEDLSQFDNAFKEHFYDINPACTVVGVKGLVKSDLLVEIELIGEKD